MFQAQQTLAKSTGESFVNATRTRQKYTASSTTQLFSLQRKHLLFCASHVCVDRGLFMRACMFSNIRLFYKSKLLYLNTWESYTQHRNIKTSADHRLNGTDAVFCSVCKYPCLCFMWRSGTKQDPNSCITAGALKRWHAVEVHTEEVFCCYIKTLK